MLVKMEKGEGVSFVYDLTVESTVEEDTEQRTNVPSSTVLIYLDEDECVVALVEDDDSNDKEG